MINRKLSLLLYAMCLLCANSLLPAAEPGPSDIQTAKSQLREHLADGISFDSEHYLNTGTPQVAHFVKTIRTDGTWPDIDYTDLTRGHWVARRHADRMRDMARVLNSKDPQAREDKGLREAAIRAYDHWISKDYRNPNWWQNEIGVPRAVAEFLLLMDGQLSPEQVEAGLKIVRRAEIGMTGQNRIWKAGIVFMRALLEGDPALAAQARDAITAELAVSEKEGLQFDSSFHQHGPQLQFGNYGMGFAIDMVKWAKVLRGTAFAFDEGKIESLRRFLVDGLSATVWDGSMDINACARQLFRKARRGKGAGVAALLEDLAVADPAHAADYRSAAGLCAGKAVAGTATNRMFWCSDYMVHRGDDWFASVRMSSRRIIGAESGNSENMKGYHLGDGALYVYSTSREFEEIFPVWDWRRLPGITAVQTTARPRKNQLFLAESPSRTKSRAAAPLRPSLTPPAKSVSIR